MTSVDAFLKAVMDMSTGVLHSHGVHDFETNTDHGPLNHVGVSGSAIDSQYRAFLLKDVSIARSDYIDLIRANPEEGITLSLDMEGEEPYDFYVPVSASVPEAHAILKKEIDAYVKERFGED